MSWNEPRVFGELGEGEMFRHVDSGRTVGGVLRKEWHVGEDAGNAVVVATGERWVFHGGARVEQYRPSSESERMLARLPVWLWPPLQRAVCDDCGVRVHCRGLVRQGEMSLCEATVVAVMGARKREVKRRARSGRWGARSRRRNVLDNKASAARVMAGQEA